MIEKFDTRLVALDFHRDIKRLTEDFVGRAWLFEEIDNWLHNTDQRFFILTGEPGSGKSAIAARLTQIRPDHIAAYHFCIASNIGTITPNTVLRSLAAQLGESLPGYSKALVNTIRPHQVSVNVRQEIGKVEVGAKVLGVVINHLTASSAEEELDILFRTPLTEVVPPKVPIIILIDSLDEAMTYHSQVGLLPLLAKTNDLPEWVRFVCTTRPEEAILSYFRQFELHTLATRSQMNLDDIEHYIDYRVDKDKMQTRLRATSIASENLTKQMADFADGNFLYVKILLDDIEAGRQLLEHLAALPRSLDDIYRGFLRRISDDDWDKKYQPILGKLTVAQEPITEKHLAQFTGMRQRQIRKSLAVVSQYLDVVEANDGSKTYRIFHQSLRDYLLDEERSGLFWCDSAEEHELLARYYLKTFQNGWRDCDLYGLRFLPIHLNAIYEYNSIHDLLLNFEWLAAKLQKTSLNELIADFNLVASDAHLQPIKTALLLSSHTLEQDKTQLAGQLLGHLINLKQDKVQSLLNQASTPRTGELFLRPLTHIFSPDRGRLVRTFAGCHDQEIFRTVVTLDGNHVISASQDGIVKVWEISTGQEILTLNSAQFVDTGFAQSYYLIMIRVVPF